MVYFLFRRRTFFLLIAPIILLLIAHTTPKSFHIGLPFVILGEVVRVWSAGYLSKLSNLITSGPFALCRNPLYIGSFLSCLGYCFMCNRIEAWIAGVGLFWLFHGGAVSYEEKLLSKKFGEAYTQYCRSVPRFVPRPRSLAGHGEFSIRQLMNNDEHVCVLANLLMVGLFALRAFGGNMIPF
ncbi:MAG: isoprenylcysteine carboxylmethyltransferase family protein [Armatimonadetes bacterium]|nr:isoprenylcysteine carboxylmethyltransferase family protein [Armatimonadota bacterium]